MILHPSLHRVAELAGSHMHSWPAHVRSRRVKQRYFHGGLLLCVQSIGCGGGRQGRGAVEPAEVQCGRPGRAVHRVRRRAAALRDPHRPRATIGAYEPCFPTTEPKHQPKFSAPRTKAETSDRSNRHEWTGIDREAGWLQWLMRLHHTHKVLLHNALNIWCSVLKCCSCWGCCSLVSSGGHLQLSIG